MKKTLAILLALVLLISLMPAVSFAAEDKMEISYVGWNCAEIEEDNWAERMLQDKFNIEIKTVRVDLNNSEQRNLMLASGEMPECGWGIGGPRDLYEVQGLTRLIPLDMVKEYAPDYVTYLDEDPIGWNYYKASDDEYYGLTGRVIGSSRSVIAVRLDWLENLGLDIPEYYYLPAVDGTVYEGRLFRTDEQWTADQLFEVMEAFTNNDPDGNGENDTIGIQVGPESDQFNWGCEYTMFGMHPGQSWQYTLANEDGEADIYFATENYKRFLEYWAKVYAAGLTDKEYVALTRTGAWEKFANGYSGIMSCMAGWDLRETFGTRPPYAPLTTNPDAKVLLMGSPTENDGSYAVNDYTITQYNYSFVVREDVTDEKLAKILEIFNYLNFDEEAQIMYRVGIEGEHWNYLTPETKQGYVLTEGTSFGKDTGLWVYNCNYIQTPLSSQVIDNIYTGQSNAWSAELYADHKLLPYKLDLFTNDMTDAYSEAVNNYATGINTYVAEYRTAIISGEMDLDSSWEDYLTELDGLGYGEIREIIQQLPTYEDYISGNF